MQTVLSTLIKFGMNDFVNSRNRKHETVTVRVLEESLEGYPSENNPKFLKSLERAREEVLRFGGISMKDYMKKRKKTRD